MTKKQIAELLSDHRFSTESTPNMAKILEAADFRLLTSMPAEVEPKLELSQLRIHQESAKHENIESWGFDAAIKVLSNLDTNKIQFFAFKGAGYSAKLYIDARSGSPIAIVVTRRSTPAPPINASGKVLPNKS
ncbi:hypothetical protein [Marinobacter sp. JSM 1782161]|uniref:hypothetical protein n=1 Tax=Marinobacter sp. JSM 1782161 TaxID=2685906 RepID=UPI0014028F32|nr:hypothetical protein [Marinobacter sp. JSM 1782161]